MNILTIIILAVFAICVFLGYQKGFLKTAFSLVSWILVCILCSFATPIVTDLLIQNTEIETVVHTTVEEKVMEAAEQAMQNSDVSELEASLPAGIKELLLGENESLEEAFINAAEIDVTPVVNGIIGIVGFVLTVIILKIIMVIVEFALGVFSKLPLIGSMDKLLGVICGAGQGLIWCWIILAVISVLALTGTNTELASYVSQSKLLTWLQDNNLLLNLIVSSR